MLCLPSVALRGVGVDDERGGELIVVVLEGQLIFSLFGHLHPYSGLFDPSTFRLMGFQQVFPGVAVKAALAKVLTLPVLALVIQKAVEILHPCVMELSCLTD